MRRHCHGSARLRLAVWLALAGVILGCSPTGDAGDGQHAAVGDPASDSPTTLTLHYPGDERVFSPAHWVQFRYLVFASLVRVGEGSEPDPWLAESWERSEDGRTWTYHLREDARWHDGVPVTAADIDFTLRLLTHPEHLILQPSELEWEVLDEHSIRVTAHTPNTAGFVQWDIVCFPKHLLEDLDPAEYHDWDFWIQPVGNGPFRYVRHEPQTFTELEANPDYFLGKPRIDRVRLRYGGQIALELLGGNVDLAQASPSILRQLQDDARFVTYSIPGEPWAIYWNQQRPQFRDPETRKALTLAIDRRELFEALDIPDEVPITDAPYDFFREDEPPDPLPYDPEHARKLLAQAGWLDSDGDGVLDRDGEPFRFELVVFGPGANAAVLVQEYLQRVGAEAEVQTLDMAVTRNRMRSSDFDAGVFRTSRGYIWLYLLGSRDPLAIQRDGLTSPAGYSNPQLLDAVVAAASSFESGVQARLRDFVWGEFQRDVPATYLHPEMSFVVAHRRVRGIEQPISRVIHRLDRLWIEDDGDMDP